jgi:hypothetical protein
MMMMIANVVGFKEEADAGEKGAIVASPPVASFQPPHPLFEISATTKHGTALDHVVTGIAATNFFVLWIQTGENFVAEAFKL